MSKVDNLDSVIEERARTLADEIAAQRRGLAHEESDEMKTYHPTYVRAKKHRDAERNRINGMVIALTYMLGRPLDMQLAEEFIMDTPTWRALL